MFSFIYLILTQKTYLENNISEQFAFCNIFPESEKIPWLTPLLNSRAEVLLLFTAHKQKENIPTLRF